MLPTAGRFLDPATGGGVPHRSQEAADTTPAAAALVMSQVAGSPRGNAAKSLGRRCGSGLAVELLRSLMNFDQLTRTGC